VTGAGDSAATWPRDDDAFASPPSDQGATDSTRTYPHVVDTDDGFRYAQFPWAATWGDALLASYSLAQSEIDAHDRARLDAELAVDSYRFTIHERREP
jgi:hypothetical protein